MGVPEFDLYLLVHPERWPSNDENAIYGGADDDSFEDKEMLYSLYEATAGFDCAYGAAVLEAVACAQRSICLLDPYDTEALIEELSETDDIGLETLLAAARGDDGAHLQVTEGAALAAFDALLEADAYAVESALIDLMPPRRRARALIGGFARSDCVRRAGETLTANGWDVSVCERTTLPLTTAGLCSYLH